MPRAERLEITPSAGNVVRPRTLARPRPALVRLARSAGRLVRATPLAGDSFAGYQPRSFLLEYAGGWMLKGQQLRGLARADAAADVLRCLDGWRFPRLVARSGPSMLLEWVEGQAVDTLDAGEPLMREAGDLLGCLHAVPIAASASGRARTVVAETADRLSTRIGRLVRAGALLAGEAARAVSLAARHAPREASAGFVHRDYAPGNLVMDARGRLWMVDNETAGIDAHDYDLARAWYRWPMPDAMWWAFLAGYERRRGAAPFERHFLFWALAAVVDSAVYRLEHGPAAADVPLRRLRALLERRSASPRRLDA